MNKIQNKSKRLKPIEGSLDTPALRLRIESVKSLRNKLLSNEVFNLICSSIEIVQLNS